MPKVEKTIVTKMEKALERALLLDSEPYTRGIIDTLNWALREMGYEPMSFEDALRKERKRKGLRIINAKS